jgi:uncharacterized heparinase superfamily protein
MAFDPSRLVRDARRALARLSTLAPARVPDAPAQAVRDPWPGDPGRGVRLMKGELEAGGHARPLTPTDWAPGGPAAFRAHVHGFGWLRDLRALGTDAARLRARSMVQEWIAAGHADPVARLPDVTGARIAAWLGHYDFFAATADDGFRQRLLGRVVADARALAAALPAEAQDGRALTALKGLLVAAVALPDQQPLLTRATRFLPQELARQILPDGGHLERSPGALLLALQDLVEIRALLQSSQTPAPPALAGAIERAAPALRALRHLDGGLALFNGTREEAATLVEQVLTQAGARGRAPHEMRESGFQRLQAGRTVVITDAGPPAPHGQDRLAHAGTLSFEMSVGRDRVIVNCGAAPAAPPELRDALRQTAAHSTVVIADTASAALEPEGLGARRPEKVPVERQEANGAHWLEAAHDGWRRAFGAIHRRRLYLAESGEDVRGEDSVEAATPQSFVVRFHLHPGVKASLQMDGEAALLRLPGGGGWRLRADGARMSLEESIYFGGAERRATQQVVLTVFPDGPQLVKWAITKVG